MERQTNRQTVMWNRRKMIGNRASSIESDIEKEADGKTDKQRQTHREKTCGRIDADRKTS
jgi:hypothetical protein